MIATSTRATKFRASLSTLSPDQLKDIGYSRLPSGELERNL
jgi:uncharacterized protein YjiS (DUF1127 family)